MIALTRSAVATDRRHRCSMRSAWPGDSWACRNKWELSTSPMTVLMPRRITAWPMSDTLLRSPKYAELTTRMIVAVAAGSLRTMTPTQASEGSCDRSSAVRCWCSVGALGSVLVRATVDTRCGLSRCRRSEEARFTHRSMLAGVLDLVRYRCATPVVRSLPIAGAWFERRNRTVFGPRVRISSRNRRRPCRAS